MPSFDIIAAIKLIWDLVSSHRPKIRVLKNFKSPNDEAMPYLAVENIGHRTVSIQDFGFILPNGYRVSVNASFMLLSRNSVIEFPQHVKPGTSISRNITSGAIDLWYKDDVYVTFTGGRTKVHHVRAPNL